MKPHPILLSLAIVSTSSISMNVNAAEETYQAKYPPLAMDPDINGTLSGNQARTLIAACRMGARYYGNAKIDDKDEALLLQSCKINSPVGNSWPEQCTIAGATIATSQYYNQNWVIKDFADTQQADAVKRIISALMGYKSPALVPLYGQASHWAAIYSVKADLADPLKPILNQVSYRDGGASMTEDADGNSMVDGPSLLSGKAFKASYYTVLDSVAPTDPYFERFVVAYDPPLTPPKPYVLPLGKIQYTGGVSLLEPGERLSAGLAELLVFDALDVEGLWGDRSFARTLADVTRAGEALFVEGWAPDGSDSDYFIVPLQDAAGRTRALVRLNAVTGEFEHIHGFDRPVTVQYLRPREAAAIARSALRTGETLRDGVLRFDPRCGGHYCASPWMPYFEYVINALGDRLVVGFNGLAVRL